MQMNDLDLNDVRRFVAIAQAGTLTAAAEQLQLPASTLSRALTRLERHLGALLVQRGPRTCPDRLGQAVPAMVQTRAAESQARWGVARRPPPESKRAPQGGVPRDHGS